ncbi:MAG: sulfite oxidase heme-binding subunit YedZ [Woeseiaceae bacterium]
MNTLSQIRYVWKPTVFLLYLVPFALVLTDLFEITGTLGANPVEEMLDRFGNWSIRFLLIALAVSPLRKLTGWNWLLRFRRMLGLFAFFYVLMHFLVWLMLDRGLYFTPFSEIAPLIVEDIVERTFITLGFAALILLTAMAITSTNGLRRRLGRNWQKLHNTVYIVGVLGIWHYWWQVKTGADDAIYYAAILAVLLGLRIYWHLQKRKKRA